MEIWVIVGHEYCDTWLKGDAYYEQELADAVAEKYTKQAEQSDPNTSRRFYAENVYLSNGYVEET